MRRPNFKMSLADKWKFDENLSKCHNRALHFTMDEG
jgi:hypothetical protein